MSRASSATAAASTAPSCPGELRPHALFVAFAPFDAPRYAAAVVVEHGNAGAEAAAPIAHDIMMAVLTRDPAGRSVAAGAAAPRTRSLVRPGTPWPRREPPGGGGTT